MFRSQRTRLGSHGLHGHHVALEVPFGVPCRLRRFPQHVVGKPVALCLQRLSTAQRLLDRAAEYELVPHDAHGLAQRLPDHRLARTHDHALEQVGRPFTLCVPQLDDLAGEHQAPGGGIYEQAIGFSEVPVPMSAADFLGDELVGRFDVRNAQQRLREAHQDDAFLAGQAVFQHEGVDSGELLPAGPRRMHEPPGEIRDAAALVFGKDGPLDQRPDEPRLLDEMIGCNLIARRDDVLRVDGGTGRYELIGHGFSRASPVGFAQCAYLSRSRNGGLGDRPAVESRPRCLLRPLTRLSPRRTLRTAT